MEPETSTERTIAEYYLLLVELRMLLDDPAPRAGHERWLLAVLDRLLAFWPHDSISFGEAPWIHDPAGPFWNESADWWRKLQRLRDRVVHRTPFQFLANEIRCDLKLLFSQEPKDKSQEPL